MSSVTGRPTPSPAGRPRGSTEAGHPSPRAPLAQADRRHRPCRRRIDYNSWRSQLFYETCSGFVPAPLNEGVFCLLIESDCSMGFLCSSPNLSLHLGIFLGLIDDKAEFFIRDLGWGAVSYSSLSITQVKIYSSSYLIKC